MNQEQRIDFNKRLLTSGIYLLVCVALFALKWCVPKGWGALGFDAAFCAISVLGSIEFLRAMDNGKTGSDKLSTPQRAFAVAFCALAVPLYVVVEMTMHAGLLAVVCAFCVYVMFLAATSVFDHERSSVRGSINCTFCMLYCGVLSTVLSALNHLVQNSMTAVLVLFVCTVLTDVGAYLIGSTFKRFFPAKLAPQLSPNKTIIGAIGGILFSIVGAMLVYVVMKYLGGVNGEVFGVTYNGVYLTFTSDAIHPLVTFVLVGLSTSVVAQIGDLFESAIKRECGIKDMGKLLPGHGGVLDRFDSMLYCGVVVLLSFGVIIV